MVEFSGVKRVRFIDGYGRTHRSFSTEYIEVTLDEGTLTIQTDGDTAYGTENHA